MKGNSDQDYQSLKKQLIETIFSNRIYKNEDLDSIFGRTILYNQHLSSERLQDLFDFIKMEMDS